MKIKHLLMAGTGVMIALSLSLTSCRKEKENDKDTSGAEDNALADKSFEDIGQISNEAASGPLNSYKQPGYDGLLSMCATITRDSVNKKIVVDFGPTNCLCNDGRYRRGKLFISYSGISYWDSSATATITTTNPADLTNTYFVGHDQSSMNQVIGTKTITNNGHDAVTKHMNWTITVNGQVIKPNNQVVKWTSQRNREWLKGESTPFLWTDDVYGVTGSANGTSANGTAFTVQITKQLIRKLDPNCIRWFTEGTFDFTPGSKPVRHVDFSPPNNGACDNVATVTINGNTYTVYMK